MRFSNNIHCTLLSFTRCVHSLQNEVKNSGFTGKKRQKQFISCTFSHCRFSLGAARVDTQNLRYYALFKLHKDVRYMTDKQKEQIVSMRMQGIGYRAICKTLNLKENQVQLFCKAHGLAGDAAFVGRNHIIWCEQNSRCLLCGTEVTQPRTGHRRKFCSGRCRTRYCRLRQRNKDMEE